MLNKSTRSFIDRVELAVRHEMAKHDAAHDFFHIERVDRMAVYLCRREGGDVTVIRLAALVHDIGDRKAHASEEAGLQATLKLLRSCDLPDDLIERVADIAHRVSFKGIGVPDDMPTLEGKIVQDADRLDAIGAIAIARTFTWGGAKGRSIHVPDEPLFMATDANEYYSKGGRTSINHFHEKLLHLKDRLHTQTAKREGERRQRIMLEFLKEFEREWKGLT